MTALPTGPEGAGDVLASGADPSERSARGQGARRWLAAGLAAAAVLGVGGGVAYGGPALVRLVGGGTQPSDVLPAEALAYAELDLNPSAGQKLAAVRFLRKFPETKERFEESKDPRASLWELISKDEEELSSLDYAREVEPWLGDRLGMVVLPPAAGEKEPEVAVALQVRNEERARQGIPKLFDSPDDEDPGFVVQDGYAVFAADEAAARRLAAAGRARSLAENPTFAADAERLGDAGVSSGWVDLSRLRDVLTPAAAELSDAELEVLKESMRGRVTYAVRFEGDDLELAMDGAELPDTEAYAGPAAVELGRLPATTVGALGLVNGDELVTRFWDRVVRELEATEPGAREELAGIGRESDLDLPADLAVLLGDSFLLALDAEGLPDAPALGAKVRTDGAQAERVLRKVQNLATREGEELPLVTRRTGDGLLMGGDEGTLDRLAGREELGATPEFRAALPELATADLAGYLDLDRIADTFVGEPEDDERKVLEAMRAVDAIGMTVSSDGTGDARLRLRIVTR